jgi:hypothetical protein
LTGYVGKIQFSATTSGLLRDGRTPGGCPDPDLKTYGSVVGTVVSVVVVVSGAVVVVVSGAVVVVVPGAVVVVVSGAVVVVDDGMVVTVLVVDVVDVVDDEPGCVEVVDG